MKKSPALVSYKIGKIISIVIVRVASLDQVLVHHAVVVVAGVLDEAQPPLPAWRDVVAIVFVQVLAKVTCEQRQENN